MPAAKDAEIDFATAYNYTETLAEMSKEFRTKLLEGYSNDPTYQQIIEVLEKNAVNLQNQASLQFSYDDKGLI